MNNKDAELEPPDDDLPRLRFIPFRRADVIDMCLSEEDLSESDRSRFVDIAQYIQDHFAEEFSRLREQIKSAYALLDPDSDTRLLPAFTRPELEEDFVPLLEQALNRANYEKVSKKTLQQALESSSLFQLQLHVDMHDFAEVVLYTRGASRRTETLREFFGLWKRPVEFTNYERVVLFIRFKDDIDSDSALGECPPGSTMLKLFRNVPGADIEMLFPNIRLGMRLIDKLIIGVPAVVSGAVVVTTRLGATLLLLGSLFGFWMGLSAKPVTIDKAAVLALIAGLGALGGYFWKQFSAFRNRKLKYTQTLTENLYFKLLDNNAGVILRVLDDAQESECKESLLAYYFLLAAGGPLSVRELDARVESWIATRWHYALDFEVEDALNKLAVLGLAKCAGERWSLSQGAAPR
ncbi:MAG: TMEM143 family protein [Pseudomonadota bacterium]